MFDYVVTYVARNKWEVRLKQAPHTLVYMARSRNQAQGWVEAHTEQGDWK